MAAMPAIIEPVASPDVLGATWSWTNPNSVPGSGSTRAGCQAPSVLPPAAVPPARAGNPGVGGGYVTPPSMSPGRESRQSVLVSKSCPGVPATCSSPAMVATTSAASASTIPAQASR